jgi:hypothetical protein
VVFISEPGLGFTAEEETSEVRVARLASAEALTLTVYPPTPQL